MQLKKYSTINIPALYKLHRTQKHVRTVTSQITMKANLLNRNDKAHANLGLFQLLVHFHIAFCQFFLHSTITTKTAATARLDVLLMFL